MRLAVTLSQEQALAVLREAHAAPGTHPAEHVLDAAEVVLAGWGVEIVPLPTGLWKWAWHRHGYWSYPFKTREEAINDAVERRMKPPVPRKGVA